MKLLLILMLFMGIVIAEEKIEIVPVDDKGIAEMSEERELRTLQKAHKFDKDKFYLLHNGEVSFEYWVKLDGDKITMRAQNGGVFVEKTFDVKIKANNMGGSLSSVIVWPFEREIEGEKKQFHTIMVVFHSPDKDNPRLVVSYPQTGQILRFMRFDNIDIEEPDMSKEELKEPEKELKEPEKEK